MKSADSDWFEFNAVFSAEPVHVAATSLHWPNLSTPCRFSAWHNTLSTPGLSANPENLPSIEDRRQTDNVTTPIRAGPRNCNVSTVKPVFSLNWFYVFTPYISLHGDS